MYLTASLAACLLFLVLTYPGAHCGQHFHRYIKVQVVPRGCYMFALADTVPDLPLFIGAVGYPPSVSLKVGISLGLEEDAVTFTVRASVFIDSLSQVHIVRLLRVAAALDVVGKGAVFSYS